MKYEIGFTYRSKDGGRVTYRPDWDSTLPWICYYGNGTAGAHRGSFAAAKLWLGERSKNYQLDILRICDIIRT